MPFPIKNYFYLNEVSARWRRNIKDVEYCIENGLIPAYIKVFSVKLSNSQTTPQNMLQYSGCKCLHPDDCHALFVIINRQSVIFYRRMDVQRIF